MCRDIFSVLVAYECYPAVRFKTNVQLGKMTGYQLNSIHYLFKKILILTIITTKYVCENKDLLVTLYEAIFIGTAHIYLTVL